MEKLVRPLLVLLAVYLVKGYLSGQNLLGGRSMDVINAFKAALSGVAKAVEAETGISARLGTIQASLESKYGNSDLSRPTAKMSILPSNIVGPALNIFGLKCGDAWIKAGKPYVLVPTNDYYAIGQKMPNGEIATRNNQELKWPAAFRAYSSWEESYRDWARLMQTQGYVAVGGLDALKQDDLAAFGKAMAQRYAPNQNYDVRLNSRASEMGLV